MKTLTFVLVLLMELYYALMLISVYTDRDGLHWIAILQTIALCGITALLVWLYSRLRKSADTKAIMKSGTALLFGIEVGAGLLYYIVEHWRWFV